MKPFIPDYRIIGRLEALVLRVAKHWGVVNQKLPPLFPVVVLDAMDLAGFLALPAAQEAARAGLRKVEMDLKLAWASLAGAKTAIRKRMQWFRMYVRGFYGNSHWLAGLDVLPARAAGADEFLPPLVSTMFLWQMIAAGPPPPPCRPTATQRGAG